MGLRLVEPDMKYRTEYIEMIEEWRAVESKLVPYVLNMGTEDFPALLEKLTEYKSGKGLREGLVSSSTYWLMDQERRKMLGAVNIRHRLNDALLQRGGHIGYGIRPEERHKGYATKMLDMALDKVRELGIPRALVTCDKSNTGSARTIRNNGGVLETEWTEPDGTIIERYWIELI